MRCDALDHFLHGFLKLRFRHQPIHEAERQRALGGNRFAGENELEGHLWSYEIRKNRGSKRRKNSDTDFGWRETRARSCNHQIAECGELSSATDCRAVHNGKHGLADFEHRGECGMKRVQHLKNALRGIFPYVYAPAENFTG